MPSYTETLNEHIRASVRRISGGQLDRFRSDVYSIAGADIHVEWREAVKDPVSQTWTLTNYSGWLSSGTEGGVSDLTSKCEYGLCFFDVLYAVAKLEVQKNLSGAVPLTSVPDYISTPHHRALAENIGIPYDADGFPLPAVNGAIITPGAFSTNAVRIAKKSVGNVTAEAANLPLLSQIVPSRNLSAAQSGARAVESMDSLNLPVQMKVEQDHKKMQALIGMQTNNLQEAAALGAFTDDSFMLVCSAGATSGGAALTGWLYHMGQAAHYTFDARLWFVTAALTGVMTAWGGLIMAGGLLTDAEKRKFPIIAFHDKRKKLLALSRSFANSDPELSQDIARFHDELLLGYHVLKTCNAFNEASLGGNMARWKFNRALKAMDHTCDKLHIAPDRKAAFHDQIQNSNDELVSMITDHLAQRSAEVERKLTKSAVHAAYMNRPSSPRLITFGR